MENHDPRSTGSSTSCPTSTRPRRREWLDSLDAVVERQRQDPGPVPDVEAARAGPRAAGRAPRRRSARRTSTPSRPSSEPWFPGDEDLERRIRAFIRWNAAVMVVKANKHADGIGGHLSTFASSAALYDVGFNHFFRGKDDGLAGDHVYFQGHAAPGIYARAFLEGRLTEDAARPLPPGDRRRRPVELPAPAAHARLLGVPDGVDGPRPDQRRSTRPASTATCTTAASTTPAESRVWCFVGDGESDEPETLGAISLAGRERLDNLIWVVNCNLQRLDGPVRGNGKIIQELEAVFRGAGLERHQGHLGLEVGRAARPRRRRRAARQDEHHRRRRVPALRRRVAAPTSASTSSGPTPACASMVEHLSDDELRDLPRGGHDYRKLYAAYKAATEQTGAPDGHPGQDDQGLDARRRRRGPQRHPPDQEDDHRRSCATLRERLYLARRDPRRGARRRRRAAVLPARRTARPSTST